MTVAPELLYLLTGDPEEFAEVVGGMQPADIADAMAHVERALGLRAADDGIGIAKHQALLALLAQRATRWLPLGSPERLRELHRVRDALDESYERRLARLGPDDPLVDRARALSPALDAFLRQSMDDTTGTAEAWDRLHRIVTS